MISDYQTYYIVKEYNMDTQCVTSSPDAAYHELISLIQHRLLNGITQIDDIFIEEFVQIHNKRFRNVTNVIRYSVEAENVIFKKHTQHPFMFNHDYSDITKNIKYLYEKHKNGSKNKIVDNHNNYNNMMQSTNNNMMQSNNNNDNHNHNNKQSYKNPINTKNNIDNILNAATNILDKTTKTIELFNTEPKLEPFVEPETKCKKNNVSVLMDDDKSIISNDTKTTISDDATIDSDDESDATNDNNGKNMLATNNKLENIDITLENIEQQLNKLQEIKKSCSETLNGLNIIQNKQTNNLIDHTAEVNYEHKIIAKNIEREKERKNIFASDKITYFIMKKEIEESSNDPVIIEKIRSNPLFSQKFEIFEYLEKENILLPIDSEGDSDYLLFNYLIEINNDKVPELALPELPHNYHYLSEDEKKKYDDAVKNKNFVDKFVIKKYNIMSQNEYLKSLSDDCCSESDNDVPELNI